jgi:benzoate membrane transport protein
LLGVVIVPALIATLVLPFLVRRRRTAFVAAVPAYLILMVAGLALLGPFASALTEALAAPDDRLAAVVTLLGTASGLSFFGIGSAFWGLVAGLGILALTRWKPRFGG